MSGFNNIQDYTNSVGYKLITTEEEFSAGWKLIGRDTKISFICDKNHENNLAQKTVINYICRIRNNERYTLCSICQKDKVKQESFKKICDDVFKSTGHILLVMEKGKDCHYKCGNCGRRALSSFHMITHHKTCKYCVNKNINKNDNIIDKNNLICRCQDKNCEKFHIKQFPDCYEKFLELIKKYEIVENLVINHNKNIDLLIEVERELSKEKISKNIEDIISNSNCKCSDKIHSNNCKISKYREICKLQGFELLTTAENYTNSNKLLIKCICGMEKMQLLANIKKGTRCLKNKCKTQKYKAFNLVNYGCINSFQRKDVKERIVEKNMENFGVEYPQQNKEIRAKTVETNKNRYGYSYAFNTPETHAKGQATLIERYGAPYPFQSKEIQEKIDKSNVEIYGAERPLLTYKSKEYTLPSGKIVNIQGYENMTLDSLLKENHFVLNRPVMESELILGNDIRKFPYTDINGKRRKYHPDISLRLKGDFIMEETNDGRLIPHHLDIYEYIEVKSFFTFNKSPKTNYEKWKAVVMTGNFLRVFIYTNTKKLWDVWWFYPNMNYPVRSQYNRVTVFDEHIELPRRISKIK